MSRKYPTQWHVAANEDNPIGIRESEDHHTLWRAVIAQSIIDASTRSRKREAQMAKKQALEWLTSNSEDFHSVCSLANLNPRQVQAQAYALMAEHINISADSHKRVRRA
jgi:hypothetical protein